MIATDSANFASSPGAFAHTTRRVIHRRGVIWLGQTCNWRCHFCYYLDRIADKSHPEHAFMSLDKAKHMARTMVDFYGNNAIDIQGGEPTIYKHIFDYVRYCRDIGLLPTLISNGMVLDKRELVQRYKDSGIRDFIISMHGIGEPHDQVVGVPGASARQIVGIKNLVEVGVPFRLNVVLTTLVLPQLSEIAQFAIDHGARIVKFIAFAPHEDQYFGGKRSTRNVPRYAEVVPHLQPAIDLLNQAGIEANVLYMPPCLFAPEYRKHIINFPQFPYDLHEWDFASWSWTSLDAQRQAAMACSAPVRLEDVTYRPVQYSGVLRPIAGLVQLTVRKYPQLKSPARKVHQTLSHIVRGSPEAVTTEDSRARLYQENAHMRAEQYSRATYAAGCKSCSARAICDGFYGDYADFFGTDEARPITDSPPTTDPCAFIKDQSKIVESEDFDWAR